MNLYDDFWGRLNKAGPGLLDLGVGLYGRTAGAKEANAKVDAAQGPLYQQAMGGAQQMLGRTMDPRAAAKERLDMEMGLLKDSDAASEADFMRKLYARGMLDMSTFDTKGGAMNPHVYAYQKALADRNAKMASESLDKGENAVTANIQRAGQLQGTAGNTQNTGMIAQRARGSDTLRNMELLKKGAGILKDTGMLQMGTDWLKRQFGSGDALDLGGYGDFSW